MVVETPASALTGRVVRGLRRAGKRIVFAFDDDLFAVALAHLAVGYGFLVVGGDISAKLKEVGYDVDPERMMEGQSLLRIAINAVAIFSQMRQFSANIELIAPAAFVSLDGQGLPSYDTPVDLEAKVFPYDTTVRGAGGEGFRCPPTPGPVVARARTEEPV